MSKKPPTETNTMYDYISDFDAEGVAKEEAESALVSLAQESDQEDFDQTFKPFEALEAASAEKDSERAAEMDGDKTPQARNDEDYEGVLNVPGRPAAARRRAAPPTPIELATEDLARASAAAHESAAAAVAPEVIAAPKRGMGGMIGAAAVVLSLAGGAFVYVQGSNTASSGTPVSADIDSAAVLASDPSGATLAGLEHEAGPFGFNDKLTTAFPLVNGKSLAELSGGYAAFTPIEGLPDTEWRGKDCSSCHTFNQASLCDLGTSYVSQGLTGTNRTEHPYGGAFKRKLLSWANHGCR